MTAAGLVLGAAGWICAATLIAAESIDHLHQGALLEGRLLALSFLCCLALAGGLVAGAVLR